jgi:hypothetical protein
MKSFLILLTHSISFATKLVQGQDSFSWSNDDSNRLIYPAGAS